MDNFQECALCESEVTDSDMLKINALNPTLKPSDVATYSVKIISSKSTHKTHGPARIWTNEWQKAMSESGLAINKPVTISHTKAQVGTIFETEFREEEGATYGKFFVPINTERGKTTNDLILKENFKDVSIEGYGEAVNEDGFVKILPGEGMRFDALSFVPEGRGGCKDGCEVLTETEDEPDTLREFAKQQLQSTINDYVKLSGFVLGTTINVDSYRTYAESMAETEPFQLQEFTKDLQKAYQGKEQEHESERQRIDEELKSVKSIDAQNIAQTLYNIRNPKGV